MAILGPSGAIARDWHYIETKTEGFPYVVFDVISLAMSEQGFLALDRSEKGKIKNLDVDQVFSNWQLSKNIFLKMKVKPSDGELIGRLTPFLDGFLYHGVKSNVSYALYFNGLTEWEAKKLVANLNPKISQWFIQFLVSRAWAQENCHRPRANATQVTAFMSDYRWGNFTRELASCGIEGLKNAPEQFKSQVGAIGSFFSDVVNDPKKIWGKVQSQFLAIQDFVVNIHNHFKNLAETLGHVDFAALTGVACAVMKSVAENLPLAIVGGGVAKLSLVLFEKLKRVSELGPHLKLLSAHPTALKGVMACE